MTKETALGFYAYKGLTIAIVSTVRIDCLFNERQRHMVSNHGGMYTEYHPSISEYINKVLAEASPISPFTSTQNRIESGHVAYISQDILRQLDATDREILYDQISLSYQILGNDTQDLHNWYMNDAQQDSVDRAIIRKHGLGKFSDYLFNMACAQVKTEHPRIGMFKRWNLESKRRGAHDIKRRFTTLDKVKKEAKK